MDGCKPLMELMRRQGLVAVDFETHSRAVEKPLSVDSSACGLQVFDMVTDGKFKRYNRQMSVLGRKMSPNVEIEAIAQMINENNTDWLVGDCDMIVGARCGTV